MSFFFKKAKQAPPASGLPPASRNLNSSDGSSSVQTNGYGSINKDTERPRTGTGTGTGPPPSLNSSMIARGATPDQMGPHAADSKQGPRNMTSPPQRPPPDLSLYPWSQRRLEFAQSQQSPFPRYGAAVNAIASPRGDIYMAGGLVNGSMVKGDLWLVESGTSPIVCSQVTTHGEGPGPRVGHASLLVGNAFIVFGGDTKIDELDVLDETLYLLNTSTRQWSRSLPGGVRPAGRYGHTLNLLGSKIFIFGGQVEGYFFNDLMAFDLNALQHSGNRWETLINNTNDGGPPQGQSPPARTNHSIVTWNDKLFLFGGTDGLHWFNDVWSYDPRTNSWTAQECIGFIPAAREGHAAALVDDVMYIFGGRTEDGKDLGDLAAFRIPTRRWYTFQNMGPSPSARSGHGMTAHGKQVYVLGGEPSSAPRDPGELSMTYVLDTSKIRYPTDQPSQGANGQKAPSSRRPSQGERSNTPQERSVSREGKHQPNGLPKWNRDGSQDSVIEHNQPALKGPETGFLGNNPLQAPQASQASQARQPRSSNAPPPLGPPPGGPPPSLPASQGQQPKPNGIPRPYAAPDGRESPRQNQRLDGPPPADQFTPQTSGRASPAVRDMNVRDTPSQASGLMNAPASLSSNTAMENNDNSGPDQSFESISPSQPKNGGNARSGSSRSKRQQGTETPTPAEEVFRTPIEQPEKQMGIPGQFPVDSGVGSSPAVAQPNEDAAKEVESMRSKNAWYAAELAMARKAGYLPNSSESPSTEDRPPDTLGENDRPLMEAMLKMRNEVLQAHEALAKQSASVADKIAQVEKQRDAAVAEAVYARTRYAARVGKERGLDESEDLSGASSDRSEEASRRLASALATHNANDSKLRALVAELEAERKARQMAEESANSAHNRASELDMHKQQSASELETLRTELYEAQRVAREESAKSADALGSSELLQVDKNELSSRIASLQKDSEGHHNILASLREAVTSSTEKAILLERKLEQERNERDNAEEKLAHLKSEYESRVAELERVSRKLEDAEEIAAGHAAEARTHREAVLAGFGKTADREREDSVSQDERVGILQDRLEAANDMVRQNQEAADHASDRLRRAEERIAGLEAYQEQASREGLTMRKQLQAASKEAVALHAEKAELQQLLTSEKMDSTALQVQHSALKDLLDERGIDASALARNKSPEGANSQSHERLRDLEQQLDNSKVAHEEMRTSYEQREQEANRGWEEKLAALDNDYQAAVKYLKGTEKMLSKMKQELHRYKSQNKDLEDEITRERKSSSNPEAWKQENTALRRDLDNLHGQIQQASTQLEKQMEQVAEANAERDALQQQLSDDREHSRADLERLRSANAALENRATEAEHKVQSLLETVGTTVNNYRRESQMQNLPSNGNTPYHNLPSNHTGGGSHTSHPSGGHNRGISNTSLGNESTYSLSGQDGTAESETGVSRNSMALDTLASELETLRTHWETTNKNYRSSGQSVIDRTPTTPSASATVGAGAGGGNEHFNENLASWRKKLDLQEEAEERSRSGSRNRVSRA
ncbi:MAG: Negative regulator of mitotic exit [Alyxoria varia]|nr:MAG: Negative regulator of mitotic exit [Alyxoria varia]